MGDLKIYEAIKALIMYQDKFLILKKQDFSGGEYEVPGGRKEKNETDEETLKREVLEETGLKVEIIEILNTWKMDVIKKRINLDGKTYLCQAFTNNIKLSDEHDSYRWVNKEELLKLNIPDWFKEALNLLKIKKCAGAIIYNSEGKIFLMTSPKWKGYVIPGGKIESNESDIEALKREIKEELNIEITNIEKINETIKKPSSDFKDHDLTFHFISFSAQAIQTDIVPNEEILEYGWYSPLDALNLPLLDSTESLIRKYIELKNQ